MTPISAAQVKELHKELITGIGGSSGIRDENLLESALASPFHTFGGKDLYPTITAKIARIAYGIVSNHPFVDGNKRIGTHLMAVLLDLYNINVCFTKDEIVEIGLSLANGKMNDSQLNDLIIAKAS